MIDLIEGIGPFLGIAAFLGLAILAFLIFQQAREVRRLREWAGRAPERAAEAAEASLAAAEARGEAAQEEEPSEPGGVARWWHGIRDRLRDGFDAVDRRMPVDPRYVVAVLVAALVAVGVLTGGFGLIGGDEDGRGGKNKAAKENKPAQEPEPEVAVLNATQFEENGIPVQGVEGLATKVAEQVVKPAGFEVAQADDAATGEEVSVVMFDDPEDEEAANRLAEAVRDQLGEMDVLPMIDEVRERAKGAGVALLVGQDDSDF